MIWNKITAIYKSAVESQNSLQRLLLLFISLFVLTACPAPGPECVEADDWGQTERLDLRIDPKNKFTPADIKVASGEPLHMEISGLVDLCPDSNILPADFIKPNLRQWQDSGIRVTKGSKINIMVTGSYTNWEGEQFDGVGLYAYIGDSPPSNDDYWYGENGPQPPENSTANVGSSPEFFELWNNGTVGEGAGFSGIATATGNVYFKYARTSSARGTKNSGNDRYSPWRGRYAWEAGRCEACQIATINAVCYPLLSLPIIGQASFAACVAGWTGGCAATGHLETHNYFETEGDPGYYCKEHYAVSASPDDGNRDHWVSEENCSDERGYCNNSETGYEITITNGCPGVFGRFMEMHIGHGVVKMTELRHPPGCDPVGEDCEVVYDDFGEKPIVVAEYDVPVADVTDLNSSGFDGDGEPVPLPSGFDRAGIYDDVVPATGDLWFKIVDEQSSKTHPEPGFYGDNVGQYNVKVVTSKVDSAFSDILNGLIDPVRNIIFGYCRLGDDENTPEIDESDPGYRVTQDECFPKAFVDNDGITHPGAWNPGIAQRLYQQLIGDVGGAGNAFVSAVRAALVLFIIIYSIMFMFGMIRDAQADFIKRVVKLAIIAQLTSPASWEFFNTFLFVFFTDGVTELISIMTSEFTGVISSVLVDPITGEVVRDSDGNTIATRDLDNLFVFADMTVSKFFTQETMIKIAGLLFATPIGFLYVILIFVGIFIYVFALIRGVVLYLLSFLAIALLLGVAPIFIAFLMFDRTRSYFDNWTRQLMNYGLQPILVFTALAIFNIFIYTAIYTLLHYRVCWDTVLEVNLDMGILPDITFPLFKFYLPDGPSGLPGVPIGLLLILVFIILCDAMMRFVEWMGELAAHITTGTKTTSLGKTAANTVNTAIKMTAGAAAAAASAGGAKGVAGAIQKAGDVAQGANKTGR